MTKDLPTPTVARSVFAIHITPLKQALSITGRKLHIAMARLAGEQYQRLTREQRETIDLALRDYIAQLRSGKRPSEPPMLLQPQFFASLAELAEAVGYEPKEARHLWPVIQALVATPVRFNSLRHNAAKAERELFPDELEVVATLLSSATRTGRGELSWAYDPKILSIMVAPRTYALLNLELVRNARTYTALALYENCRRFVGIGQAGPYPFERWQQLLSPEGRRPAWEDSYEFMRRVKRAIEELEACEGCDIKLTAERVKVANQGTCLQVKVKTLEQPLLAFGEPLPRNRDLVESLRALGFTASEVRVMTETHGDEYLLAKLEMLAKAQKSPKGVGKPKAWLTTAVEKDFQDEVVQQTMALHKVAEREERTRQAARVREAFQAFQAERIRVRFSELEEDARARWEVLFAGTEAARLAAPLAPKAREASFFGWLSKQEHALFQDPEEQDPVAFSIAFPTKTSA